MKKTLIALSIAFVAAAATAAQVVEAIVIRVGDRVITRTQYEKRLREGLNEIEQAVPAAQKAAKKDEFRKGLTDDLIAELLVKDRADRLGLSVTDPEVKDAVGRLKEQYGI